MLAFCTWLDISLSNDFFCTAALECRKYNAQNAFAISDILCLIEIGNSLNTQCPRWRDSAARFAAGHISQP